MLGYWKWLIVTTHKLSKMLVKWSLSKQKIKFARQIAWLISDFAILIVTTAATGCLTGRPGLGVIVIIVGLFFILGHMIYIDLEGL